ncbi:hypothetical protein [Kineosporia succinea]|uniref:ParB-like N-terminal domain-containing protein n=1 Tax=Kineosporia succinea TaxID=84632 RepID=A0ABT9PCF5_9ACTN|nr:hypothetical protein [Kineosporia succinea]MDP9829655.1 hypothetical protein [Kineosporia succinea]
MPSAVVEDDVPLEAIRPGPGLRLGGLDQQHVERLVEVLDDIPPILLNRASLELIDGAHRVAAALHAGRHTITAKLVSGSELDLLSLSLSANARHGLPLTRADRRQAVARVLELSPDLSNRHVATLAGVSPGTVARVRTCSTVPTGQSNTPAGEVVRRGADGRRRPLSTEAGKLVARELFLANPEATQRQVAAAAGISLGTAHRVHRELLSSGDPQPVPASPELRMVTGAMDDLPAAALPSILLERLVRDPAMCRTAGGRELLARLRGMVLTGDDSNRLTLGVPAHRLDATVRLIRQAARAWMIMARDLEARAADADEATALPGPS